MLRSQIITGGVVALGNFDGVHRGHRVVLAAAVAEARARIIPARVLTFEPHPRTFFKPDQPFFRLTPAAAKERLLKQCGIDDVTILPFSCDLARLTAPEFVEKILIGEMKVQHIVAGHDFAFGAGRGGDMESLRAWLEPQGIGVTEIAPQGDGTLFSSTRVREALKNGEPEKVVDVLGRDWSIAGTVVHGAQRGRTIGVPTANLALGDYLRPKFGVYAIRAGRVGEPMGWRGVANIGVRPTVDGQHETLEAHLFDFNEDIYGQEWEFALTRFLRPEMKFASFDALKTQIFKDIEEAKGSRLVG